MRTKYKGVMAEKLLNKNCGWRFRSWIKREKARLERRRAKRDPEVQPGYGRYSETQY
jgi:hypothetical protein